MHSRILVLLGLWMIVAVVSANKGCNGKCNKVKNVSIFLFMYFTHTHRNVTYNVVDITVLINTEMY